MNHDGRDIRLLESPRFGRRNVVNLLGVFRELEAAARQSAGLCSRSWAHAQLPSATGLLPTVAIREVSGPGKAIRRRRSAHLVDLDHRFESGRAARRLTASDTSWLRRSHDRVRRTPRKSASDDAAPSSATRPARGSITGPPQSTMASSPWAFESSRVAITIAPGSGPGTMQMRLGSSSFGTACS